LMFPHTWLNHLVVDNTIVILHFKIKL
jgi:hypothetical protein